MRNLCVVLCCFALTYGVGQSAVSEDRFEVWLHNGERFAGQAISPLYSQPAEPLKLDNKTLGKKDNPPLALHCPLVPNLESNGAWLEFTNGDVVPGKIAAWSPPQNKPAGSAQHEQLLISLEAGGDFVLATMAVRPECVRRIWTGNREPKRLAPGTVNTVDGREIVARGLRFGAGGLECLTEKGVLVLGYDQLREASFAAPPNVLTATNDSLWGKDEESLPGVVRIKTARGCCLTCGNQLLQRVSEKEKFPTTIHLLPNWAVQTIQLLPDRIRWVSWRNARELPLASLPYSYTTTTKGAQHWSPQRNRNVQGSELRSTGMSAEQGWGVHSGTTITVELPVGAERFHAWVGLDQCSGRGGCARAKVLRDQPGGEVLWESDFLLGAQAPREIDLDVRGAKSLVLVVEEAHENRPNGADPWDIRDHVDWLWPMLTVSEQKLESPSALYEPLGRWIPALAGFELSKEDRARTILRPVLSSRGFRFAIVPLNEEQRDPGISLTRKVKVTNNNARIEIAAGMDGSSGRHHHILVEANGKPLPAHQGSLPVGSHNGVRGSLGEREYSLGPMIGQEVALTLWLQPDQYRGGPQGGIVIDAVSLGLLVANLPASGKYLEAEIPITSTKPQKIDQDWVWSDGKSVTDATLVTKDLRFEHGTALPAGSQITIPLDPSWKRFVAVVGKRDPYQGSVQMVIQLDGEPFWENDGKFEQGATAAQLDLELPPDHKIMTIKVNNREGFLVLGNAGFMTK